MDHDIVADDTTPSRVDPASRPVRSVAMAQQVGQGLQSWPQQFVRLVGGHRGPAPVPAAPLRVQALTG